MIMINICSHLVYDVYDSHLAILTMSLDQPTSCWREVLLSSLMLGAENLSTVSQKYNLGNTNLKRPLTHIRRSFTHQQILGRFEGEEDDESVWINFGGYLDR